MKKIKIYDNITEQIVREVFFALREELGYEVISSRAEFPDYLLLKDGKIVRAEAETLASNFYLHKHPEYECDLIICYKNDLQGNFPLEILELEEFIELERNSKTSRVVQDMRGKDETEEEKNLEKILLFLQENFPRDFCVAEIAENITLAEGTVRNHIKSLMKRNQVLIERTVGRVNFYNLQPKTLAERKEGEKNRL